MQQKEHDVGAMSKSIGIVMVFTLVGKVAGFVREVIFAGQFGTGTIADAYINAQLVPGFVLSILIAAFSAALITMYPEQQRLGKENANQYMNNLLTVGFVASLVILALTWLFLEPIVTGIFLPFAPPETQQQAIQLSKTMLTMELFVFLARMVSAYLQANFSFAIPAFSQVVQNIVLIAAILLAGGSIQMVAVGTVISWAAQFLVQVPAAMKAGLRYRPRFSLSDSGLRGTAFLMLPAIIPAVFDSFYMIFAQSIASQNTGYISALGYGNRLSSMVSTILLTTVATVLYPSLVGHIDRKDKLSEDLSFGINVNFLIAIPASVALILLAHPITKLLYERQNFTAESTVLTAGTLACYAAGILGLGIRDICNRCFYAYKSKRIPFVVGLVALLLNVFLNYLLYPVYGPSGIAASMSISSIINGFALLFLLDLNKKVIHWKKTLTCLWKVVAATAAMAGIILLLSSVFSISSQIGKTFALLMLLLMGAGIGVYLLLLWLLKVEELHALIHFFTKKLHRGSTNS